MKKGFTLVEVMIVMAIIGLLVAIAIPKLEENRNSEKNKTIESSKVTESMDNLTASTF